MSQTEIRAIIFGVGRSRRRREKESEVWANNLDQVNSGEIKWKYIYVYYSSTSPRELKICKIRERPLLPLLFPLALPRGEKKIRIEADGYFHLDVFLVSSFFSIPSPLFFFRGRFYFELIILFILSSHTHFSGKRVPLTSLSSTWFKFAKFIEVALPVKSKPALSI